MTTSEGLVQRIKTALGIKPEAKAQYTVLGYGNIGTHTVQVLGRLKGTLCPDVKAFHHVEQGEETVMLTSAEIHFTVSMHRYMLMLAGGCCDVLQRVPRRTLGIVGVSPLRIRKDQS